MEKELIEKIATDLQEMENALVLACTTENDKVNKTLFVFNGDNIALLMCLRKAAIEDNDFYQILKGALKLVEQEKNVN